MAPTVLIDLDNISMVLTSGIVRSIVAAPELVTA
jgi:hypothetical protein